MGKLKIVKEFFQFASERKKIWMIPVFLLLVLLGVLIIAASESSIAPFIYALF